MNLVYFMCFGGNSGEQHHKRYNYLEIQSEVVCNYGMNDSYEVL